MSVRKSRKKLKTNVWKIEAKHRYAPKFFKHNPLFCSFSLQVIFFSEKPFYGNYSTLDSHTHTVISHTFTYSSRWRRKPWQGLFVRLPELVDEFYLRRQMNGHHEILKKGFVIRRSKIVSRGSFEISKFCVAQDFILVKRKILKWIRRHESGDWKERSDVNQLQISLALQQVISHAIHELK